MFGLFMAILFATVFIANGIKKYIDVYQDRKHSIENGWDHYHDQNGMMVHIDDGLPYTYKNINGDVYEINPYSYKIRRNITKERDAAKLRAFRQIAKEKGIRFVEDITVNIYDVVRKFDKPDQTTGIRPYTGWERNGYSYKPCVDTLTGNIYITTHIKKNTVIEPTESEDNDHIWLIPDPPKEKELTKYDDIELIPYLLNPATGFIEGVNQDLFDPNKKYPFLAEVETTEYSKLFHKRVTCNRHVYKLMEPTEELIAKQIDDLNSSAKRHYKWEIERYMQLKEKNDVEAKIQAEIKAGRERGERYI